MSDAGAPEMQVPVAVPLRRPAGQGEEPRGAWASEETVPLQAAAKRVEAEEREERLALVTRRRRARWH